MSDPDTESFAEFSNSFSYGSRNDLSFKFLKRLGTEEAAEFVRLGLWSPVMPWADHSNHRGTEPRTAGSLRPLSTCSDRPLGQEP